MEAELDGTAFDPAAHDPREENLPFEAGHATDTTADEEEGGSPASSAVHTTTERRTPPAASAGPSSPFTRWPEHVAAVHVDPRRSHTVAAAAAAARKKAGEEATVEPLTAENETWGHWSFRHVFNGFIMMLAGLYQVVHAGARRQPADMKTIEYTNSVYMSAPPRAEELKKQKQQQGGGSEHGSA